MSNGLATLIALVVGYLLGSINSSVIVGRLHGKDIHNLGSKSAGLTNSLRVLGKKAAARVLVGDVLKGIAACLIGLRLGAYVHSDGASDSLGLLAAGAGAVIGHNWPIYFKFKGGKGALTAAAVMFMLHWQLALVCLGVFIAVIAVTRFVSLGTLVAIVLFVGLSFVPFFKTTFYFQIFSALIAAVIIFKHRENIQRLVSGTENKLKF
jgi:glycerol-3-phosphate acyltransferase PlsY